MPPRPENNKSLLMAIYMFLSSRQKHINIHGLIIVNMVNPSFPRRREANLGRNGCLSAGRPD